MKLSTYQKEKLKAKIEKMKGKPFTIRLANGKKFRVAVYGIKGDYVEFRSVRDNGKGQVQLIGPLFLFPLFFFLPFLFW